MATPVTVPYLVKKLLRIMSLSQTRGRYLTVTPKWGDSLVRAHLDSRRIWWGAGWLVRTSQGAEQWS